jgi:hypothetical protein
MVMGRGYMLSAPAVKQKYADGPVLAIKPVGVIIIVTQKNG